MILRNFKNIDNKCYSLLCFFSLLIIPIWGISQTHVDSTLFKKIVRLSEESKEESFDLIINELHNDTDFSKLSIEQLKDWEKAIEFIPSEKEYFELKHLLWAYFSSLRAERFPDEWMDLAHSYYYSSAYAFKIGNYIIANQFIDLSIGLYEEHKKEKLDKIYVESILFKASILDGLQLYGHSFNLYEKAALAFQEVEDYDPMFLASLYMNLGVNNIRYGFYEKAKNNLDQAKKIFIDHPENVKRSENKNTRHARWLDLYTIYSRLFYEMKDEDQLLSNKKSAQDYIRGKPLSSFAEHYYAQLNNYIGFYYLRSAKDPNSALLYFKKAYDISTKSLSPRNPDFYMLNIARSYLADGQLQRGRTILDSLVLKRNLPSALKGYIWSECVQLGALSNNLDQALSNCDTTLNFFSRGKVKRSINDPAIVDTYPVSKNIVEVQSFVKMAQSIRNILPNDQGPNQVANHLYEIALKQFYNSYSKSIYSDKLKTIHDQIVLGLISTQEVLCGKNQYNLETYDRILNYYSQYIWKSFVINRNFEQLKIPSSLMEKEKELITQLTLSKTESTENSDSLSKVRIFQLEEELQQLRTKIEEEYATFQFFENHQTDLKTIQKNLSTQKVLLQFLVLEDDLYKFTISQEGVTIDQVGLYENIKNQVNEYINLLQNTNTPKSNYLEKGQSLSYQLQLDKIKGFSEWVIIADGVLHNLPFETLSLGKDYLIQDHQISYLSSLSFFNFSKNSSDKVSPLVISPEYANQENSGTKRQAENPAALFGAQLEAKTIHHLIGGTLLSGDKAQKSAFLTNAPQANIIHLAMHANENSQNQKLSYLLFTKDDDPDPLYLNTLYGMNLTANMVVLSACKSGLGKPQTGEGIIALNRAFTFAGVPTTISSLWDVPDQSTQNIMIKFYESLKEGVSPAKALQKAKLTFLNTAENPKFEHPIYWAGFVHHGNNDPLYNEKNKFLWIFSILAVIAILLIWINIKQRS